MDHRPARQRNFATIRIELAALGAPQDEKRNMWASARPDDAAFVARNAPPRAEGLVARTRLLDVLDRAPPHTVLWVAAPPAAGKSALAATWLHDRWSKLEDAAALWYQMDEVDADPLRFFATLGGFLGLPHGFGADIPPNPTPQAFMEVCTAARRWFEAGRPARQDGPRLFVFDDVHNVPPEAVTIALLPVLAAALRPDDRVLCLSRLDPPQSFGSASSEPSLTLITDLRAHPDEFADFARDLPGGHALSRDLFLTCVRRSGGWISGVLSSAWAQVLQPRMGGAAGFGTDSDAATERRALLVSAFLQAGNDSEWGELAGVGVAVLLGSLADAGNLVSRLPDGILRKHDAFQAVLMRDAEAELPPDMLNEARLKAARLLGRRHHVLPAVRLLIESGARDEALRLVLDEAASMSLSGHNQDLQAAIELLPPEVAAQRLPRIWLAYARMPYEPRQSQRSLGEIRRSLQPETAPLEYALALNGETRAALSDFFDFQELPQLIEEMDRALPKLGDLPAAMRLTLVLTRSMAMLISWPSHGEIEEARSQIESALPSLPQNAQLLLGSVLVNYLIWWRGDLAAARPFLNNLEGLARHQGMAPLAVMTWYYGALSRAYHDADDDTLRRLTDEVVAFAGARGVSHRLSNAFWVITQSYAAAGDLVTAEAMLERYTASARQRWRRTEFIGLHHLRAVMALCAGDTASAIAEADRALGYAKRYGGPHQTANQSLLLAMAFATNGSEAARPHIDELRRVSGLTHNATFAFHADLAEAMLAFAEGGDVAGPWNRSAEAARRLGVRRIAAMNRVQLAALANRALSQGADIAATRRVIALWQLPPPEGGIVHDLWPFPVEIRTLGGFVVEIDGARIGMGAGKAQRKPMELLWSLVAGPSEGMAQEEVADQLWPELDGDRAMHALRTTIYRLRKLIGARAVRHEDDHIRLNADHVRTDVARLRSTVALMRDRTTPALDRLSAFDLTLRLYRGPFLPGIRLAPISEARDQIRTLVVTEGIELLMRLDHADPATALRAGRLRTIAPEMRLPPPLERLLPY
jgi:hypothetical protein